MAAATANRVSRAAWLLLATSGALLLGALWFQYGMGLPPCQMCYWQRYAHLAVMALAFPAVLTGNRMLAALAIMTMLVSAGLGGFHAGVEQKWWTGPGGCSGSLPSGISASEMFDQMLGKPLVRCDAIPWSLFGVSMAGWNAIVSVFAALAATVVMQRKVR